MEQTKETKKEEEVLRREIRQFRYSSEVSFEFEVDVSNPEGAIAEITDFMGLLMQAHKELEDLRGEFSSKLDKEKKETSKKKEKSKESD